MTASSTRLGRRRFTALGLFLFSFLLYSNTLRHDYALDDYSACHGNRYVQQGVRGWLPILTTGFMHGYDQRESHLYRPVLLMQLALEKEVFGNNPHAHHFFNVLLYALTCVLLFFVLGKLFQTRHRLVPLLSTLLFVAHPIHTEVVANIKNRDEMLCFFFLLAMFYALWRYLEQSNQKYLGLSLVFFLMSLLSKEHGIAFLLLVPLVLHFFTEIPVKRNLRICIPYLWVALIYLAIRLAVLGSLTTTGPIRIVSNSLMAAETYSQWLATSFVVLGKYLLLLFWPHPLSWDYSYAQIPLATWSSPAALISLAVYLLIGLYGVFGLRSKNPIAFAALYYLITLSLVSHLFIKIKWTLGERFLFTPSLGFCLGITLLLDQGLKRLALTQRRRYALLIVTVGILTSILSWTTISRNPVWANNQTLAISGSQTSPRSARVQVALANAYKDMAESEQDPRSREALYAQAVEACKKSLEIHPRYPEAYYQLGFTLHRMGNREAALEAYQQAVGLNPAYDDAYNNMVVVYLELGDPERAVASAERISNTHGTHAMALRNIGLYYLKHEDYTKALSYFERIPPSAQQYEEVRRYLEAAENP